MKATAIEERLAAIPGLEKRAHQMAHELHDWVLGTPQRRRAADALHGTWLGHPMHAAMTDIVIGAWSLAALLDLLDPSPRSGKDRRAADLLIEVGIAAAVPTALAGLADFSAMPKRATASGAAHALLNGAALVLTAASAAARRRGARGRGVALSSAAVGLVLASAWLGGDMSYRQRVGVNKTATPDGPAEWTAVLDDSDLTEGHPRRVEVGGQPVALFRLGAAVRAIAAVCSHEGGPLAEGEVNGGHVACPWHQSVFDLADGSVVHGPSTYGQPSYETRLRGGRIEVRRAV